MQAFRTAIWVFFAVVLTVFALFNLVPITVRIWPGYDADTYLPILLLATFLIGFLPPFLMYRAQRWSARRTIGEQERVIADLRTQAPVASTLNTPVAHDVTASPVAEAHPS